MNFLFVLYLCIFLAVESGSGGVLGSNRYIGWIRRFSKSFAVFGMPFVTEIEL